MAFGWALPAEVLDTTTAEALNGLAIWANRIKARRPQGVGAKSGRQDRMIGAQVVIGAHHGGINALKGGPKGGCFHCGGPHYAANCPQKGKGG